MISIISLAALFLQTLASPLDPATVPAVVDQDPLFVPPLNMLISLHFLLLVLDLLFVPLLELLARPLVSKFVLMLDLLLLVPAVITDLLN
jgi:hypothetical protein